MNETQIGKLNGETVYLAESMFIEKDNMYLKHMNNWEIAQFVHQTLGEKELHGLPDNLED